MTPQEEIAELQRKLAEAEAKLIPPIYHEGHECCRKCVMALAEAEKALAKFDGGRCPSCGFPEEPRGEFEGWIGMKARAEAAERKCAALASAALHREGCRNRGLGTCQECIDAIRLIEGSLQPQPAPEPKPIHARVSEYDGSYECLDCNSRWGALPDAPLQAPLRCEKPKLPGGS